MMTKIQDVQDIQGPMLRHLIGASRLTPTTYAQAHARYLAGRPGAPRPHQSDVVLRMGIYRGQWKAICPECSGGISTGRLWTEARCFTCGAVFASVEWPEQIVDIERTVLKRPLKHQHWHPGETLDALRADNARIGVET